MADYSPILDTQTDPDAPLTSDLAKAWAENPVAISEGAAGAPRIQTLALATAAAGATHTIFAFGDTSIYTVDTRVVGFSCVGSGGFRFTVGGGARILRWRSGAVIDVTGPGGVGGDIVFQNGDVFYGVKPAAVGSGNALFNLTTSGPTPRLIVFGGPL